MHPLLEQLRDREYEEAGAGWIIDLDHINVPEGKASNPRHQGRAGTSGPRTRPANPALYSLPFQVFDDDGVLYYTGRLIDDDEAVSQVAALEFATIDAGATAIKVLRDGVWIEEIS